jgi:hypothetical protein
LNSSQLPAVRVVNGTNLPSHWGLTVATPMPIYVLGDYNIQTNLSAGSSQNSLGTTNTAYTWPAALMGDAVTILSDSWKDSVATEDPSGTATTVNAACLEGIVQSTMVGSTKHYSGGLENFLRLLENWNNNTLTYNGSIVVMFPSQYATNFWVGPGTYYGVPTRKWGFDANFTTQSKLPPLTPQVKQVVRGQWGDWNDN